jgi:histidinol-phosphate aminotransferase
MHARVDALITERHRLASALTRLPDLTVYPSGANFVLVRVDGDAHALWQRLVDRGVLVRDFSAAPRLEGCLRITVGTPTEDDALLDALRESLEEAA